MNFKTKEVMIADIGNGFYVEVEETDDTENVVFWLFHESCKVKMKLFGYVSIFKPGTGHFFEEINDEFGDGTIEQYKEFYRTNYMKNKEHDLAERIYNSLAPWDRTDTSIKEIEESIRKDPIETIEYLISVM